MICNVISCSVTLRTLQRTKLRYRARQKGSGARRPAAGGVGDGSRQGRDRCLAPGLVHDTQALKGTYKAHTVKILVILPTKNISLFR